MRCSLYFFALRADDFSAQMREPKLLLGRVADRIRQKGFDEAYAQKMVEFATSICTGNLPADSDTGYFDALCWLAEVAGEKIEIPGFILFRGLDYFCDIGIWPWFQKLKPPFVVPVCSEPPPEVGFLYCSAIEQDILAKVGDLPAPADPEAANARLQVVEVLETIVEDGLDVLAVWLRN